MFTGRNLNDFIRNKPPLVIFTLCLIALTVATFSFAFYIQHAKIEDLTNTDFKENWINLLKHFNRLHTYIQDGKTVKPNIVNTEFSDKLSVYVPVQVDGLEKLKNFSHIQGILTLEGWVPNCPKDFEKPDFMVLSFSVPDFTKKYNKTHICVQITGPKEYLPTFSEPTCQLMHRQKNSVGILKSSYLPDQSESSNKHDIKVKLEFDPYDNDNFAVHLKPDDVSIIYMHLMWCSYSLAFIVIIILLYAVFHKDKSVVDDI